MTTLHPATLLAQQLVKFPSLTPVKPEDLPAGIAALEHLAQHARTSGAEVIHLTFPEAPDTANYQVPNLLAVWKKGDWQSAKHIPCFLGHTDVVPVGNEADWKHPPFSGTLEDGFLYGRGTTDMKGAVAAFFTAAAQVMNDPNVPDACFMAVITGDEEWNARHGTREVLSYIKEQTTLHPTVFLVGEPSSPHTFATHYRMGRRGSQNHKVFLIGKQGHAAYPALFDNPHTAAALVTLLLNEISWNEHNPAMDPTNLEVTSVGQNITSTAIIPGEVWVAFNVRMNVAHSPDEVVRRVEAALANAPYKAIAELFPATAPHLEKVKNARVVVNPNGTSWPYLTENETHYSNLLENAVSNSTGITPQVDNGGGTSDGRFPQMFFPGVPVLEFGLPANGGSTPSSPAKEGKGGLHQTDERLLVTNLEQLTTIYTRWLGSCLQLSA